MRPILLSILISISFNSYADPTEFELDSSSTELQDLYEKEEEQERARLEAAKLKRLQELALKKEKIKKRPKYERGVIEHKTSPPKLVRNTTRATQKHWSPKTKKGRPIRFGLAAFHHLQKFKPPKRHPASKDPVKKTSSWWKGLKKKVRGWRGLAKKKWNSWLSN